MPVPPVVTISLTGSPPPASPSRPPRAPSLAHLSTTVRMAPSSSGTHERSTLAKSPARDGPVRAEAMKGPVVSSSGEEGEAEAVSETAGAGGRSQRRGSASSQVAARTRMADDGLVRTAAAML